MNTSHAYAPTVIQLFGAPSMIEKNPNSREVMVHITDAAEIASIEGNDFQSILGYKTADGTYWAYKWSADQYRQRSAFTDGESHGE